MSTISSIQVPNVTIREATDADAEGLRRLAERDSAVVPEGPLVIGEVDGEIRAAVSISTGATIADPFSHSRDIVGLVHTRADQLRRGRRRRARIVARTPHPANASVRLRTAA